jgi:RNA polymerase sigma factor (sigma-70 family)
VLERIFKLSCKKSSSLRTNEAEDQQIFGRNTSKAELEERFHQLLSVNGAALSRLAASYTNSKSDRDDLFQDIALAIWLALPRFRGESSERTFIFRIAHNRAITFLSQRRTLTMPDDEIELPDPRPNPEKELAKEQQETRLFEAIHNLPIDYRQVITLILEGMSYTEIAEIFGIGESNVGVRLNRARQMLRRLLEVQK